jgi:hypothetical protein
LLRYDEIAQHGLPKKYSFGFGQVEVWDKRAHPDATLPSGQPDYRVVFGDPIDSRIAIVGNRWVPLLTHGRRAAQDAWQMQYIEEGGEELKTTVYWTEHQMKAHDPIFDRQDRLLPHLHVWEVQTIFFDPGLHEYKLKKFVNSANPDDKAYKVWWRVLMVREGASVKVKWEIVQARSGIYKEDERLKPGAKKRGAKVQVAEEEIMKINSEEYSPFVRE